jgi:MFS transporter, FHS family, L-fucose permease
VPFVQGMVADSAGVQPSFFVPAACYLFILFYGLKYANLHQQVSEATPVTA